jgi:hypothetical protein
MFFADDRAKQSGIPEYLYISPIEIKPKISEAAGATNLVVSICPELYIDVLNHADAPTKLTPSQRFL